jgi:hypothetical protein
MKKKQFESVCKQILPRLPGFACKGWLLYAQPLGRVLRGFYCDGSGFDREQFTVHKFCLPLYVPTTHIYFLFGDRLKDDRGCSIWWNINDPDLVTNLLARILSQGVPFLSEMTGPREMIKAAERLPETQECHRWETIAYSDIMVGDYREAGMAFKHLANAVDMNIPWQVEVLERAKQLEQSLQQDVEKAKQLLEQWEQFSAKNLGLPIS